MAARRIRRIRHRGFAVKPAQAASTYSVDFRAKTAPRRRDAPKGRIPRVVRMLGLAHEIDRLIRAGELRDLAEAARSIGVTRARITQIANLLLLAPEIQAAILELPLVINGRDPISERTLRTIVAEPNWQRQMELWNEVKP